MSQNFKGSNNPNWKEVKTLRLASKRSLRNHIIKRDKICQDCGNNNKLQVHHIDSNQKTIAMIILFCFANLVI
jgi:hypothetical protein